jgi:hypothetical protein
VVFRGKPEPIHLLVPVLDVGLLDPDGRIFRRLGFNSGYGKVVGVYPDFATI